jgi:signal transduction histidine kinase
MLDTSYLAIVIVAIVGIIAFQSNPREPLNIGLFSLSFHIIIWLIILHLALLETKPSISRATATVGAFLPIHFWFVAEKITRGKETVFTLIRRAKWWILTTASLAGMTTTEAFISSRSTRQTPVHGHAYEGYICGIIILYIALFRKALHESRQQTGVKRLELEIVLLGGSSAATTIMALMALSAIYESRLFITLQPVVIVTFYSSIVVAITTHRLFDARQILIAAFHKIIIGALSAMCAYGIYSLLSKYLIPDLISFGVAVSLSVWYSPLLTEKLDRYFQLAPNVSWIKQAIFDASRQQVQLEYLEPTFMAILKKWLFTDHVFILWGGQDIFIGSGMTLMADSPIVNAMKPLRWATPERLSRLKKTPERDVAASFLSENKLAALVLAEGADYTTFIGVGSPLSKKPLTFPVVSQLLEVAALVEAAFERAHFLREAKHAEQLAVVGLLGASLAHEIRNPLASIKTFVQLLPKHTGDNHFCARFIGPVTAELSRVDELTTELLELASPRVYSQHTFSIHSLIFQVVELLSVRTSTQRIKLVTDLGASPDQVFTDPSATKQVLINLCFNSIHAVEEHSSGDRWIKLSTRNAAFGIEIAVSDSGNGIPPEKRARLFQPFQSTKPNGFGLGLAISRNLVTNFGGIMSVDPYIPKFGAIIRVTLPIVMRESIASTSTFSG